MCVLSAGGSGLPCPCGRRKWGEGVRTDGKVRTSRFRIHGRLELGKEIIPGARRKCERTHVSFGVARVFWYRALS